MRSWQDMDIGESLDNSPGRGPVRGSPLGSRQSRHCLGSDTTRTSPRWNRSSADRWRSFPTGRGTRHKAA